MKCFPGRPMQVVNRLLCVIALIMAVGGGVALYIHALGFPSQETMHRRRRCRLAFVREHRPVGRGFCRYNVPFEEDRYENVIGDRAGFWASGWPAAIPASADTNYPSVHHHRPD